MSERPALATSSFLGEAKPLVLARLFSAGLTMSIPLVLARVLSREDLGTYYQLFLLSTTLYYVLPLGVVQSLYFFLPRAREKRPYLGQTLIFMSGAGLVAAGLVVAGLGPVSGLFDNPALAEHRWTLAAYTAFLLGAFPLEVSLTSQGRMRQSALVYLVADVIRASAMVVPCLVGAGLHGMMLAVVGFAGLRWLVAWVVVPRGASGPLVSGRLWREQLVHALPFGAAMALAIPQQNAHLYAVAGVVSPALYAIYRVGCFQLPVVDLLYTPISEVLMVRLGELEKQRLLEEGVEAFREAAGKLAFVFLPFAAFLFAAAPEFILALFGDEAFLQAVPIFRVSVLGAVLAILPMDAVLRARGLTRAILVSYLLKAVVTVPLLWVGVRHFGMMGGVVAWAMAEMVGKGSLLVRVPGALSTPTRTLRMHEVIPWGALGKASLAAVVAAAVIFPLRAGTGTWSGLPAGFLWRALPLVVVGLLFSAGYVGVLYATGIRPLRVLASLRPRRAG